MPERPTITVQLIHIEGPLKGNIEEFTGDVIHIGRHPDCQVRFPKDTTIVSRNHAEIMRDGNRFKVVDHSTNGTFLNGKTVKEAALKTGDVLMIGDGGPKVSFLAEMQTGAQPAQRPDLDPEMTKVPASNRQQTAAVPEPAQSSVENQVTSSDVAALKPSADAADNHVQAPLIIQFGPTIQSFKMLPVVVGKRTDCDFIIDQTNIIDRHVQIFFFESNYWIKDLTGQQMISVNDMPVRGQTPLHPGSRLSLSPQGPVFEFLSGGRLAETSDMPVSSAPESNPHPPHPPLGVVSSPNRQSKGPLFILIGFLAILVIVGVLFFVFTDTSDQSIFSGLKEWWHQLVKAIRQLVGRGG